MFEKPVLTGRAARWLLLLSEFDITYVTKNPLREGRFQKPSFFDLPKFGFGRDSIEFELVDVVERIHVE